MTKAKLILADLWKPTKDEPPDRSWPAKIESGKVIMNYADFVEALEIMKGCYTKRLRLLTESNQDLRTLEQLK